MRKMVSISAVIASAVLMLVPTLVVSATPLGPIGYDCAWFENDPYIDDLSIKIGYTHWDSSSFVISLKDPNGVTKQTWSPSRNYPNIGYKTFSLENAIPGDWHIFWQSTTSGEGWDHARVRYLVFDYDTPYFDEQDNPDRRVGGFSRFACSSGQVGLGVSFDLAAYAGSPNRHLVVKIATHFEDLNSPIQNNIVSHLVVRAQKVNGWCSSPYTAGGVYGTTYGSNNSRQYSDIDMLSVYDDDAGSDDLVYAGGDINWDAVIELVAVNVLTAVLTAGTGIWITAVGYAIELAYDIAGPDLTTTAYRPNDAAYGSETDIQSEVWWDTQDNSAFNTTTYNWANLRMGAGDTSYCWRFMVYGWYDYNGAEAGYSMYTQYIYLCVCP